MPALSSPMLKVEKSSKGTSKRNTEDFKENETEFTQRIINTKPHGIKGLGFVLRELKKAQMKGLFADAFKNNAEEDKNVSKGLGILGKRLKENVITKLDVEQKSVELMKALKANKNDILDRLMKE